VYADSLPGAQQRVSVLFIPLGEAPRLSVTAPTIVALAQREAEATQPLPGTRAA